MLQNCLSKVLKAVVRFSVIAFFVIVILCMNMVSGCNADPDTGTTFNDSTGGVLSLTTDNPDRLTGKYVKSGYVLNFDVSVKNETPTMTITNGEGVPMFVLEDKDESMEFSMLGKYTQVAKKSSFTAYKKSVRTYAAAIKTKTTTAVKPSLTVQTKGDSTAVSAVSSMPEYDLLPWLSRALGEFGYTGKSYPASFVLHGMGMRVATEKSIEIPELDRPLQVMETDESLEVTKGLLCKSSGGGLCLLGNCPKNKNGNPALGMCGPGNTCWWFVCDDCCVHAGCLNHDLNCGSTTKQCALNFWQFFIGGCLPAWV